MVARKPPASRAAVAFSWKMWKTFLSEAGASVRWRIAPKRGYLISFWPDLAVKEDRVPLPVSEPATDIFPQRDAFACLVGLTYVRSHPSAASNRRVIYNSAPRPSRQICFRQQTRATMAAPCPSKQDPRKIQFSRLPLL